MDSAVYGVGVQRWVMMNYVVWLNWALTTCLLLLGISQRPSHLLDTAMVPIFIFHMRKLRLKPLDTGYTGYTESNCEVCGCSLKPSPTGSQDCLAASSAVWSYALSGLWWDFWLPRFVDKKNGVQDVLKHCASNLQAFKRTCGDGVLGCSTWPVTDWLGQFGEIILLLWSSVFFPHKTGNYMEGCGPK